MNGYMGYFSNGIFYLCQSLLNIYVYFLLLRFILQLLNLNYFNPVVQVLVKFSDFLVKPLRRVLFKFKKIDVATLLLVIIFQWLAIQLMVLFKVNSVVAWGGVALVLFAELGKKVAHLYLASIIIQAVLSWVPALYTSPAAEIVYRISDPLLRRARQIIPAIAGIDFSTIPVIFLIYIILSVILNPLLLYGLSLLMG